MYFVSENPRLTSRKDSITRYGQLVYSSSPEIDVQHDQKYSASFVSCPVTHNQCMASNVQYSSDFLLFV